MLTRPVQHGRPWKPVSAASNMANSSTSRPSKCWRTQAYGGLQPFLDDRPSAFTEGSPNPMKVLEMTSGTDKA
jgi:hypothetical protein